MIIKSTREAFDQLAAKVKKLHPYDVPEVGRSGDRSSGVRFKKETRNMWSGFRSQSSIRK